MNGLLLAQDYIKAYSKNWGWFFVWGLALFILGIVSLSATTLTTMLSVMLLGFLLLFGGIIMIIDTLTFWWHKWSGFFLHLLMGILYAAIGIMFIKNPEAASISITLFLGIFYLLIGIVRIIFSVSLKTPRWGWSFFNGLISLVLGGLILSSLPTSGLFIIGIFISIDLLFCGITYMTTALAAKSLIRS